MKKLDLTYDINLHSDLPEKIIQFGEGKFPAGVYRLDDSSIKPKRPFLMGEL